jgi:hypothetical protein
VDGPVLGVGHGPVDCGPRPLLGRREEVGVDAQGEAGVGVAEEVGDGRTDSPASMSTEA